MQLFLGVVAAACAMAAGLWSRAAVLRWRFLRKVRSGRLDPDALWLAEVALWQVLHTAALYGVLGVVAAVAAVVHDQSSLVLLGLVLGPVVATVSLSRHARRDARVSYLRFGLEQRATEVISQENSATRRWAERLAPSHFPEITGYEIGSAHQAGEGHMPGDLLDVLVLPGGRVACVVGDVAGHDVEASISALQTKFLLRTYLRRYRDPAQALEELNRQLIDHERPEEFVSVFVAVLDGEASTIRYASAGHPAAWLCHDRSPRALNSTGPLLMVDANSSFRSVELPWSANDLLVVTTDGLLEARSGQQFFGEQRLAGLVRRDFDVASPVLCKGLIDEAVDFSAGPLVDDVTVLAVRKR